MLAFCHLFIGMAIGLVLFHYTADRRLMWGALIGSILPDLIDKPLGHILLQNSLDYGRIFGHGLAFAVVLFMGAMVVRKTKHYYMLLAVLAGVLSHHVLDLMWELPVSWLYPILGEYGKHSSPNYFKVSFLTEITSPFEWLFFLSIVWLVAVVRPFDRLIITELWQKRLDSLAAVLLPLTIALGSIWIGLGLMDWLRLLNITDYPQGFLMTGLVAVVGSLVIDRWIRLHDGRTKIENSLDTATSN